MRLADLVEASRDVAAESGRRRKIERLAALLRAAGPGEAEVAVAYLCGELRQGRIGIGPSALHAAKPPGAAPAPALTLAEADAAFERIAGVAGGGSAAERGRLLRELLERGTSAEQDFLVRLCLGELRQGALEGVVVDAVAAAAGVAPDRLRRAVMLAGSLRPVAAAALTRAEAGLAEFSLQLFQPLRPMLAGTAEGAADALSRLQRAALEYKLDGARVQVHKSGDDVRVYSRQLNDVTAAVPEIVEWAARWPLRSIVLDGEAIALRDDGRPHAFQVTMRRFGRKLDVDRVRGELPLSLVCFDCLHLDGRTVIDAPAAERFAMLESVLPRELIVPRIVTADALEAEAFLTEALHRGHEGIMAKSLEAAYEAGSRGSGWLKVKPAHTLDLVVLAAEWGHGRRSGWLSNLHLGARDPAGGFVMLGKTFKGMTDEVLAWQTRRLQEIEVARDRWTVHVRPELVVEVAFSDVQASSQYPGGVALRFARIKRYRPDKRVADADTIEMVRALRPGQK